MHLPITSFTALNDAYTSKINIAFYGKFIILEIFMLILYYEFSFINSIITILSQILLNFVIELVYLIKR